MILYTYPASPNGRRIAIYLKEKGLTPPFEEVTIDLLKGDQHNPDYLEKNPLGKVPTLQTDDGVLINQSLSIVEYLEERYPQPAMIGDSPSERARVKALERFIDFEIMGTMGIIAQNTMPLYTERFGASNEVVEYARKRQEMALEQLDQMVGDQLFVAGERPTIADCTLYAIYEFAFMVDRELNPDYPNLYRWHQMFARRSSVQQSPIDREALSNL